MRDIVKNIVHRLIELLEDVCDFHIPRELPLKQKLSFIFGFYEYETSAFIKGNVHGGIAFDVGAHIGYYSRLLSSLVDTVYAFEPEPRNFALLVKNTKNYPNIIPVQMAVSDKIGSQKFFLVKGSTFRHSLIDEGDCESICVNTTTMDSFVKRNGIENVSFVKVDVEGNEEKVLAGMSGVKAKYHPLIVVEKPVNDTYTAVSPAIGRFKTVANYIV